MTLLELCEPLFQFMCRLNRSARKGAIVEHNQVRVEIAGLFKDIDHNAAADPGLMNQLDKDKGKIGLILTFFVDFIIKESKLTFASQWEEIAAEKYNELAGDEKFWDLLEETLSDRSEAADERLMIYYICIGLGFTGWYSDQPEHLRTKMREISVRVRDQIDVDDTSPIVSEAELYVNTDDLIEPPGKSLIGIGIALVALILVLFIGNIVLFSQSTASLNESLDAIINWGGNPDTSAAIEDDRPATERVTQISPNSEDPTL